MKNCCPKSVPSSRNSSFPSFGEGLGLDSLDAVEIVVLLQRNFGVTVKETEKGSELFRSIRTIAEFVVKNSENPLGSRSAV